MVESVKLTEEQIEAIAEKAAEKAVAKITTDFYTTVGKSVVTKFFTVVGIISVAFFFWAQSKGLV